MERWNHYYIARDFSSRLGLANDLFYAYENYGSEDSENWFQRLPSIGDRSSLFKWLREDPVNYEVDVIDYLDDDTSLHSNSLRLRGKFLIKSMSIFLLWYIPVMIIK